MYYDTDSCYFVYDPDNTNHKYPTNDQARPATVSFAAKKKGSLGQWENYFDEDEYIVAWVCGGAKSYAYRTNKGKVVVRQKGITLDVANNSIFTFDAMRDMVLNQTTIESAERFQFKTDPKTKDIITKYIKISVKSTIGEKRVIDGFDTLPFGFEEEND